MVLIPANITGPAAIRHDGICRAILINPQLWHQIPPEEKKFIIEHELAHCRHNVFDEVEADRIGFINYVEDGGDPDIPFQALVNHLHPGHPNYYNRTLAMRQRKQDLMNGQPISHFNWNFNDQLNDFDYEGGGSSSGMDNGWGAAEWLQLSELLASLGIGIAQAAGNPTQGNFPPPQPQRNGLDTGSMLLIGGIAIILIVLLVIALRK